MREGDVTEGSGRLDQFRGCLLGGAVGDALGAPIEFMSVSEIHQHFGPEGVRGMTPGEWPAGSITDDTQMTLFTAEGLLRAQVRGALRGIVAVPTVVHHAYARWLQTQGEESPRWGRREAYDGWLIALPELHARRAPGMTCLSALQRSRQGTTEQPLNDSKGCGGVMRVGPVGLLARRDRAFTMGVDVAALTHGHPSGYLAAGFLAAVIAGLRDGDDLEAAVDAATAELEQRDPNEEVGAAVRSARRLAGQGPASVERLEELGDGWVAEEALAIALYAVLATHSFEEAVLLAVNHGGDSDSTGAITGNLAGFLYGDSAIPSRWLEALELMDEIGQMAGDLHRAWRGVDWDPEQEWERYPGW